MSGLQRAHAHPAGARQTAQYNPESGKTWATYVGSGAPPPPAGLAVRPKENPDAPEQH